MTKKLVGHEFASRRSFDAEMAEYISSGGWKDGEPILPPRISNRVYRGEDGKLFVETPSASGVEQCPIKQNAAPSYWNTETDPRKAYDRGGFVPAPEHASEPLGGSFGPMNPQDMGPQVLGGVTKPAALGSGGWAGGLGAGSDASGDLGLDQLMGGMASQLPPEVTSAWLGDTAVRAMTAAAPGGMLDGALRALGMSNPLAGGPLGEAMGAALRSAGLGDAAGGMLGTLMNQGASGLAKKLGSQMVNEALDMAGLDGLPGMGALSGLAGGALGKMAGGAMGDIGGLAGDLLRNGASGAAASLLGGLSGGAGGGLADLISTGGFAGPLGDAGGAFGDIMGGCFPGGDSSMSDLSDLTNGGCFDPNAGGGLDLDALGSQGLDKAVDHMMSQWQVDDESSAAEHIAHKMVSENLSDLKSIAKDELLGGQGGGLAGLGDKIKKFFSGEAPGTGQPAMRMGDLDDQANVCITGIANIKFEGQPVARRTDTVAGPTAPAPKPIVIGEPTVISAGMETAFVLAPTAVPSKMAAKGATSILVGGAVVAALQEAAKKEAEAKANAAPKAPAAPDSASSGSASEGQAGEGQEAGADAGAETAGTDSADEAANGGKGESADNTPTEEPNEDTPEESQDSQAESDADAQPEPTPNPRPEPPEESETPNESGEDSEPNPNPSPEPLPAPGPAKTDQERFDEWYEKEKEAGLEWTDGLPDCPETIPCETEEIHGKYVTHERTTCESPDDATWSDPSNPNYPHQEYHPGATYGIRTNTEAGEPGNQCTYDKNGDLIPGGAGAGTADKSSPGGILDLPSNLLDEDGHRAQDVSPYELALKLDGGTPGKNVEKYLEVRPTQEKLDEYRASKKLSVGEQIAINAESYEGNTDYERTDSPRALGVFPTNKCNQFVYDRLAQSGQAPPLETRDRTWSHGLLSVEHPPTAHQWASSTHKIDGYQHVGTYNSSELKNVVQPGDIISDGFHVAIASREPGRTVSAATSGEVVHNDWGYRENQQGSQFGVRRVEGDKKQVK